MNITETNRHAIAIAEAYIRVAELARYSLGSGCSFKVVPKSDVTNGPTTATGAAPLMYRTIEVTVSLDGDPCTVLDITLMRAHDSEWNVAIVEVYIVGWISGSHHYWARFVDQAWQVRKIDCIARAKDCDHFQF